MKKKWFSIFSFIAVLSLAVTACGGLQPLVSNDSGEESAEPGMEAVASQGEGPTVVTGSVAYTDLFFTMGVAEPIVILEDQGGFVTRDRKFLIPTESQVMGQITSDFYTSPFTYSLTLPADRCPGRCAT